jgi:hypothetical protein
MIITGVSFKSVIQVGGKHTAIDGWRRDKHAEDIELQERGNWIYLFPKGGKRVRVPMSNVSEIADDGVDEAKGDSGRALKDGKQ